MKNLLVKECSLAASPLSFIFIAFGVMAMIPGYPILVGAFFVCLGLYQTYQASRENNDILYTVMLPVRKADAVKAKFIFTCFIELAAFLLMLILTLVRMALMGGWPGYTQNFMMNANPVYLGWNLIIFALFNIIFVRSFFKTAYKIGAPFVKFIIIAFIVVFIAETLHHIPGLEFLNAVADTTGSIWLIHWIIFAIAAVVYIIITLAAYRSSVKDFEKVDL